MWSSELSVAPLDEAAVTELLYQVIDPELGINIVDLGLLRNLTISSKRDIYVVMTLTTPACPLGPYIIEEIQQVLGKIAEIGDIEVEVIWSPAWDPERDMSDQAKKQLGWAH